MSNLLRNTSRCAAALIFLALAAQDCRADSQQLSKLAVASYSRNGAAAVIDTTGTAKIRVSFPVPGVARVQVSPSGQFTPNPSFAAVPQSSKPIPASVASMGGALVVRDADIVVKITRRNLHIAVYGSGGKALLTGNGDGADGGARWDSSSGAVGQQQALASGERIYGLGQDNANGGRLDRRGTVCDLWTGQQIRSGNVTAEDPVPFYLSTGRNGHGYGVFVDNVWRLRFDIGKTKPNQLDWSAPGGPIDYYVIDGPSLKTVVERYTQLTGRPAMLPLWAFGYWQSKCVYTNFDEMRGVARQLRSDGIPVDVMVIDYSWPAHFQDFQWGKSWLASSKPPAESLAAMHAEGLHVVQSNSGPMIRKDSPNYPSGWKAGVFATDGQGNPVTCGYYGGELMDFTSPKMPSWLWPQLAPLYHQGIDGWWLDLIEPENEPAQTLYYAGPSPGVHNTFSTRVIRDYYEFQKSVAPDSRPVILGRAGTAGVQRYGPILWSGDTHSDWPTFRAHIPEAQNSGLSGLPWWTNDSGGFLSGFYKNDRYGAHAQLYARWMEFSSFAPIARAHKAGPSEPFQYGPLTIRVARKYLGLRYRLLPYIYSCAYETHETGLPLLRPLVLEDQSDPIGAEAKDEFLFGPNILVAPVLHENATSRSVYLPRGSSWIGLEDGCQYPGGATITADAPFDRIPLFVRDGAILPMAPAMLSTSEKPWDPISLEIYPHGDSEFTLYADDGHTTAFEHGAFTQTAFRCHEGPGRLVTFSIAESNLLYTPKTYIARFHLTSGVRSVTLDGQRLKRSGGTDASGAANSWAYQAQSDILEVRLANGGAKRHAIRVALDGTRHPRPKPPTVNAAIVEQASARP